MSKNETKIETKEVFNICFTKSADEICNQMFYSQKAGFLDGHG